MVVASTALWLDWNLSPTLVLGIGALAVGYWYVLGPLARRERQPVRPAQVAYYAAGLVTLVLALMSPLDALGDTYLFSAHMVQHMLLSIVAPPLLLLGLPAWVWERLVPGVGARRSLRWLANPILAFGLLNADLWLWHAPALYDATLANETLHVFEHLTFVVFGLIFWLPIIGPAAIVPRLSRAAGVLYLFVACQPMVALGALLTFAPQPFYQPYVVAPRLWGFTALGDQQLGGLIMWMPTNIPYLIGLSVLFFQWVGAQDRSERERAASDADAPYELFPSAPAASQGIAGASAEPRAARSTAEGEEHG